MSAAKKKGVRTAVRRSRLTVEQRKKWHAEYLDEQREQERRDLWSHAACGALRAGRTAGQAVDAARIVLKHFDADFPKAGAK